MMVSTAISPAIGKGLTTQVVRANEIDEKTTELFNDMMTAFNETTQWPSGHTIRLRTGKCRNAPTVISLCNNDGWIKVYLIINGKTQYQSNFVVGYRDVKESRWTQARSCTLEAFHQWRRKCTGGINRLERQGKL